MALPIAAGAMRLLASMTKGTLRQTKRLSPFKRSAGFNTVKVAPGVKVPSKVGGKTLRPFAQTTLSGMKKVGFSKGARDKTLYGYNRGYKRLAKHKKLYGAGVGGAVVHDIFDKD